MPGSDASLHASVSVSQGLLDDVALLSDVHLRAEPDVKKFSYRSTDTLVQALVSRHYANTCWELSHLLWFISQSTQTTDSIDIHSPILDFFWLEESVYSTSAKYWFMQRKADILVPDTQLLVKDTRLKIKIRDHVFELSFSRINVLACFAEFVVNLHPNCITEWQTTLWQQGLNGIRKVSSDMQKYLYDYLSEHLPPVRMSKKYAYFVAKASESDHLSRERFIDLWRGAADIEGLARLNACFDSCMAWKYARDYAHKFGETTYSEALDEHTKLMSENSDGVFQGLQDYKAQQIDLSEFAQQPKLLSKSQIEKLQIVGKFPEQCISNAGALFVIWVFSPVQAVLIQALRNKMNRDALLDKSDTDDSYQSQLSFLNAVMKLNEHTMMACWQVIRQCFPELSLQAFTLNNAWVNLLSKAKLITDDANTSIVGDTAENTPFSNITLIKLQDLLPSFIDSCQQALKKNNRQGFTELSILPEGEGYVTAIKGLVLLNKLIARLTKELHKEFNDENAIQAKFLADRSIIKEELVKRYVE
ncbi:hypothetical protein [Agaribacter marinus]|uniref:Uncharacterized protein n=1 Tax=Agaribacter marinus TaxID=1431249 RepID=A0AA37STT7_9ALTE|nr:hypothetical protein [Agaribacter marinus]GLR69741.1 hypothetical protein GCM10007852_06490 [Agaribacter marinus]